MHNIEQADPLQSIAKLRRRDPEHALMRAIGGEAWQAPVEAYTMAPAPVGGMTYSAQSLGLTK